jgi:large subunit ribosomal protein L25
MSQEIVFKASRRDLIGKRVKILRREGKLPAVVYGKDMDPVTIALDQLEASKMLREVSSSTLVVVDVDGEKYHALVRERQRDVLRGDYLHVDLQAVSLTETVRANVTILLEGEAPAVESYGAMLVSGIDQLEVEALPQDLPESISVDISGLVEIGDTLYVRDLILPKNVEALTDPEELLVVVSAPEVEPEEEEEVLVEDELFGEMAEPEVVERGKREEDEIEE